MSAPAMTTPLKTTFVAQVVYLLHLSIAGKLPALQIFIHDCVLKAHVASSLPLVSYFHSFASVAILNDGLYYLLQEKRKIKSPRCP